LSEIIFSTTCSLSEKSAPIDQRIAPIDQPIAPIVKPITPIVKPITPTVQSTEFPVIAVTDEQTEYSQNSSEDISDYDIYEEEYCVIKHRYFLETLEPKKEVLAQYLKTDKFHETIPARRTMPPPLVKNLKTSSAIPDINSKDLDVVISNFHRSWSAETTDNKAYKEARRKKPRQRLNRTNL